MTRAADYLAIGGGGALHSMMQFDRYGAIVIAICIMFFANAATASKPVPRTIEACVISGVLTGPRYTYKVYMPTRA